MRYNVPWLGAILFLLANVIAVEAQDVDGGAGGPTLDDAVYIYARVDEENVYLGEPVVLTLEYWELKLRGIRVQPHYNTAQPVLPDAEGFFVSAPARDEQERTRGEHVYNVTTYRAWLYPARTGTLQLGAWNWAGTVRAHTATGAQSRTLDLRTPAISITVRPLPTPPPTFLGAVGELEIALALETRDWSRGEPVNVTITLSGTGNPHAVKVPPFPEVPWFSAGDPAVVDANEDAPVSDSFVRQYRVVVMPLGSGEQVFPSLSLSYFSPSEGRYKEARTPALPVRIAGGGPGDALVVIGGGQVGSGPAMNTMEDGRLPIVATLDGVERPREWRGIASIAFVVPPIVFLVVFLVTFDFQRWRQRAVRRERATSVDERLAAVTDHPRPFDALNVILRDILTVRIGRDAAAMSIPEVRDCLQGVSDEATSELVVSILGACESLRYGQGDGDLSQLLEQTNRALPGLPREKGFRRVWRW